MSEDQELFCQGCLIYFGELKEEEQKRFFRNSIGMGLCFHCYVAMDLDSLSMVEIERELKKREERYNKKFPADPPFPYDPN